MGDLPVPPKERLPTQMIGILKDTDLNICLWYNQFLMAITKP